MNRNMVYGLIMLLVAAIAAFFIIGSSRTTHDTPAISLPSPVTDDNSSGDSSGENSAEVTPETVQAALKTLSRINAYSRTFSITTYWEDGSSTSSLQQWQKGENMRLSYEQGGSVKNLLLKDGSLSVWYEDSPQVITVPLGDGGISQADRFSGLITYEELMRVPVEKIINADYQTRQGEPCIYVEYSTDEHYVNRICVSINSGLLIYAQIFENDTLIYQMELQSTELSTPADDVFAPPSTKTA